MSVYSLVIHEKVAGKWDAQSYDQKIKNKIANNLNKTPPGLLLVWTVPVVLDQPWSVIVGGGGVNLYFYRLGTATNVFSMEDNDSQWSQSKQEKCIPQNFIYICSKN